MRIISCGYNADWATREKIDQKSTFWECGILFIYSLFFPFLIFSPKDSDFIAV